MNTKVLNTLEYTKIISMLCERAASSLGKEYCQKLLPSSDITEIRRMQTNTADALSHIYGRGEPSFSGVKDIRPSLLRLEMGASLGAPELLAISSLLHVASRIKTYSRDLPEDSLTELFDGIEPLTPLAREIDRCIPSPEEISDDASPALKHIRRSMLNTNNKVHEQLNALVNGSARSMLQENIITMRNGRYCLPIKAEYRSSFQGMLHDQSSTGSTLFMEPMSVVKLNNELKELQVKEQEEIEKILADLSNLAGEESESLKQDFMVLSELDFIFAKGKLAREMKATEPDFNENGGIYIKQGRHPLIDSHAVVPIDIRLGEEYKLLIVTGPNTGGKTVSLKTTGLFTLMGQAGLHIPAAAHSELAIFEEIYADIGDEQSIEQSLSTFSSHMTNTISIMEQADSQSLVLFDELGAGTDPTEGAALAIAILSALYNRGTITMATTHYSELKLYALSTEGVENACCEFDVETLRPTYRLLIGIPGKSNAFAISGKLGLSDDIIEDAKKHIDSDAKSFEDVVSELEASRLTLEKEKAELAEKLREVTELQESLKAKNEKIDKAKDKILRKANEKANEILSEAKDFADDSIRKYNKWMKDGGVNKEMEERRQELRNKLNKTDSHLAIKPQKKKGKKHKPGDFKIGDTVRVLSMNSTGSVISLPNAKGDLFIQMGIFKSPVNINDLEIIADTTQEEKTGKQYGGGKIQMNKGMDIRTDINLIGKTTDEAIPILDKYLDDAYLAHLNQVTVIHGRGTGALKNAVHALLKRTSYVKSYRLGEFGEGDQGVTIVTFK